MIQKIISGGQTGADQGGLAAAKALSLATGGWMPCSFLTEDGPNPTLAREFHLEQHSSFSYSARTRANVLASSGTLIFGDAKSSGSRYTLLFCQKVNKVLFTANWGKAYPPLNEAILRNFRLWLTQNDIVVLNVAGNRETINPGIFAATRQFLVSAIGPLL